MVKLIAGFISNLLGVVAAKNFIAGFSITEDLVQLAIVIAFFTIANSIILPVLRFIFKPITIITLGLFALALNGLMIYAVDFFSENITISGLLPLLYTTVLMGAINATVAYFYKVFKNNDV
ncbi:MAG: phage holin family protein [Patescibacteria group bacterium]